MQANPSSSHGGAAQHQPVSDKAFSTLQARAALAGFELVRMADSTFVASRRGIPQALAGMEAVESYLRAICGRDARGAVAGEIA
jgi:hypothetical protein